MCVACRPAIAGARVVRVGAAYGPVIARSVLCDEAISSAARFKREIASGVALAMTPRGDGRFMNRPTEGVSSQGQLREGRPYGDLRPRKDTSAASKKRVHSIPSASARRRATATEGAHTPFSTRV